MHQRFQGPAGVLVVLLAAAPLTTGPASAQAPSNVGQNRPAKPYTPPRTPDGQPDLQGFWTNSTYTPLERPDNVTKEFYTPEELAAVDQAGGRSARARRRRPARPPTSTTISASSGWTGASRRSRRTCARR